MLEGRRAVHEQPRARSGAQRDRAQHAQRDREQHVQRDR